MIHHAAEQMAHEFLTRANTIRCAGKVADKWGASLSVAKTDMFAPHKYHEADASNKITSSRSWMDPTDVKKEQAAPTTPSPTASE